MPRYRVLLVDDEEEIRVGIGKKIDWERLGFVLSGEAENGVDALEMAEQLRPDVVLTDIKMPFMDGLTLCRQIRALLPAAKSVVFSGYNEFEFARQAIGINVSEYILKPINAAELTAILEKLRKLLDQERTEQRNMETLRRRYEESLPQLREVFFTRLLDGWIKPGQLKDRADRYDIRLPDGSWAAALVYVHDTGENDTARNELLLFSVRAFVSEHFSLDNRSIHLVLYNDTVAILAHIENPQGIYPLIEELGRLCSLARSYLDLSLTIGVGLPCNSPSELGQSAQQAQSALEYRMMVGRGRVLYLGDIEPDAAAATISAGAYLVFDDRDERELSSVVKLGTDEQVRRYIAGLIDRVSKTGLAPSQCNFFILELLAALIRLARGLGIPPDDVFGHGFTGTLHMKDFGSLYDLETWCYNRCLRLKDLLGKRRADSAWNMVEKAKEYISSNFADSTLAVDTLCHYLHLSPAYFSTLFKRETGVGFASYVTGVRMEAAQKLLRETTEKTYLIALRTGYPDPNYFSYAFKKHFGVSPSQYRSAN